MVPPIEAYRIRARIVRLECGTHRLRYVERPGSEPEAFFLVAIFPDDMKSVDRLHSTPGVESALRNPGDTMIIRATRAIRVVINTVCVGASSGALLEIDLLDGAEASQQLSPATEEPATARVELLF